MHSLSATVLPSSCEARDCSLVAPSRIGRGLNRGLDSPSVVVLRAHAWFTGIRGTVARARPPQTGLDGHGVEADKGPVLETSVARV